MTPVLWVGAAGAWLFIATFLVDGWTRPGYRPLRDPVSALALGSRGWVQSANFILCGAAITAGAVALASALGDGPSSVALAAVVGFFGLSLVASGIFPMDPMRGFPPGTPEEDPAEFTRRHVLHDWAGMGVFFTFPLAGAIAAFSLDDVGWQAYSALTALAGAAAVVVFGQAWEQNHPLTGLVQRVAIVVGWVWVGLLFVHAAGR